MALPLCSKCALCPRLVLRSLPVIGSLSAMRHKHTPHQATQSASAVNSALSAKRKQVLRTARLILYPVSAPVTSSFIILSCVGSGEARRRFHPQPKQNALAAKNLPSAQEVKSMCKESGEAPASPLKSFIVGRRYWYIHFLPNMFVDQC